MKSSLTDPVLFLSMDQVAKMHHVDIDQLADLWHVFTKCAEVLESGRRLENLSWRLWFREAHLTPPDMTMSELASPTASLSLEGSPLPTPLNRSRAGSFATEHHHHHHGHSYHSAAAAATAHMMSNSLGAAATLAGSLSPPGAHPHQRGNARTWTGAAATNSLGTASTAAARTGSLSSAVRPSLLDEGLENPEDPETTSDSSEGEDETRDDGYADGEDNGGAAKSAQMKKRRTSQGHEQAAQRRSSQTAETSHRRRSSQPQQSISTTSSTRTSPVHSRRPSARFIDPAHSPSGARRTSGTMSPPSNAAQVSAFSPSAAPSSRFRSGASSNNASSGFGSRARVRQRSQLGVRGSSSSSATVGGQREQPSAAAMALALERSKRRRPVSFQAALESLALPVPGAGCSSSSASGKESQEKAAAAAMLRDLNLPLTVRPIRAKSADAAPTKAALTDITPVNAGSATTSERPRQAEVAEAHATKDAEIKAEKKVAEQAPLSPRMEGDRTATPNSPVKESVLPQASVEAQQQQQRKLRNRLSQGSASSAALTTVGKAKDGATSSKAHRPHLSHGGLHHHSTSKSHLALHHRGHHSKASHHHRHSVNLTAALASAAADQQARATNQAESANSSSKGSNATAQSSAVSTSKAAIAPAMSSKASDANASGAAKATTKSVVAAPAPTPVKAENAKRKPVTFTMGGDESDEDDTSQSGRSQERASASSLASDRKHAAAVAAQAAKAPVPTKKEEPVLAEKKTTTPAAEDDDEYEDDGDWSSEESSEDEEAKAKEAARLLREKREQELFKKVPIRSKSAADVRMMPLQQEHVTPGPSPPQQPVRGLLSSIFHPEAAPHPPPGQLAGRPHASAADLRRVGNSSLQMSSAKPQLGHMSSMFSRTRLNGMTSIEPSSGQAQLPRTRSSLRMSGGAVTFVSGESGGLKTSKSAVALPLLNMTASRSTTSMAQAAAASVQAQAVGQSASKAQSNAGSSVASSQPSDSGTSSSASMHDTTTAGGQSYGSSSRRDSVALAKLNELASGRNSMKASRRKSAGSDASRNDSQPMLSPPRRPPSTVVHDDYEEARLVTVPQPEEEGHETEPRETSTARNSISGETYMTPTARTSQQRKPEHVSIPTAPGALGAIDVPEGAAPQTPRTTRRNMLRDELSESLRQNLLWERQSRNRMLGIIGGPMPQQQQQQQQQQQPAQASTQQQSSNGNPQHAHHAPNAHRKETVLSSGSLRPLTSTRAQNQSSAKLNAAGAGGVVGGGQSMSRESSSGSSGAEAGATGQVRRTQNEWGASFHHTGW